MFGLFRKVLNRTESLEETIARADKGDVTTQFRLAALYAEGVAVPQDYMAAARWFGRAATQGHILAQYNYGVLYAAGKGVPKDYFHASKWFRLAAEQGDPSAQFHLGRLYALGKGVPRDDIEAYKWYHLAAEQGEPAAQDGRELVAKNLNPQQLTEAKKRAAEFYAEATEPQPVSTPAGKA